MYIKGGYDSLEYQMLINEKMIQQDMYYKNQLILSYTIKYPQFISNIFRSMACKLNTLYRTKAVMYEKNKISKLFQMAMVDYEHSIANHFPIHRYEAYISYTVTYNQNCALSIYFDQYEYTGGAHGLTTRTSDTWDLQRSRRMQLDDFFPNRDDDKEFLITRINQMIKNQAADENYMYFDPYEQLVSDSFKKNSFYLTTDGLVIYFQQYDIAPYAAGMPSFLIPYEPAGPIEPKCT